MANKVMEIAKIEYTCECCGKVFRASPNRDVRYCSKRCLDVMRKRKQAENRRQTKAMYEVLKTDCPNVTQEYISKRAEKILHQQDREVWVSDYAERQKAKTLAMIGEIKV